MVEVERQPLGVAHNGVQLDNVVLALLALASLDPLAVVDHNEADLELLMEQLQLHPHVVHVPLLVGSDDLELV